MSLDSIAGTVPSWMSGADDAEGIVISCRARLARNLSNYAFAPRISVEDQRKVIDEVLAAAKDSRQMTTASYFSMNALDANERRVLVERHLISPSLAEDKGERGILFNQDESLSVMINEEDHLRLQAIYPGTQAQQTWAAIAALDAEITGALGCAHDDQLGFLTACPTNTGTGLRASILIHLPALVLTEDMERVLQGLNQLSFTVRGVYGEGSNASGNLFQVSNQATLGSSEEKIVEGLLRITSQLVEYEKDAQQSLLREARSQVEDKVWRAYGLLQYARVLSSQEFMNLLSAVRLGLTIGLLDVPAAFLNHLMIATQPAHMQAEAGSALDPEERDLRRAQLVRRKLTEVSDGQ
ncbi:MAG: protein arginine kinase [Gemmatimonadetes bacterium]|jgi:protein arginine kinase|nr:protein arginine kinase [Gemmatimonadota bacterium]MBT7861945.1 protein arginine kinase [Gemmatimonadota bacterium]